MCSGSLSLILHAGKTVSRVPPSDAADHPSGVRGGTNQWNATECRKDTTIVHVPRNMEAHDAYVCILMYLDAYVCILMYLDAYLCFSM